MVKQRIFLIPFSAYSKRSQVNELTKTLGSSFILDNGEPIIDAGSSSTTYFAKGHLSPDAAFVYDAQQDATYYFMNVAPQFQTFNNGNWKAMEGAIRDYAIRYPCKRVHMDPFVHFCFVLAWTPRLMFTLELTAGFSTTRCWAQVHPNGHTSILWN